ncbi:cytochrome b [Thauera linaloolentis]|uniref:Cytochrome B561 n=1 Tax=Thauera linaloolentis (strain DSM 12138 / JCM 21573 / CCUG 41526 / CIP 105981 / IAM 15112 / NBRC 102519 / 47Lol) TaxID=1123367 RepID=N6YUA7_THAL4|nr:cytochrome b/b6 domain-containing protein [Thauera linaloolentis]ENO85962.1 cytochrome B561 [Thauera linaloolentis 47Lol = DSM 12138]MCM8567192.1 cytochrome b/b6 domain-containing protein [Thauera linaloolentis]
MSPARYDPGAISLHWVHAALIATLFVIGLSIDDLPRGPERSATIALHKSLGIMALLLLALRLAWRRLHPPPADGRLSPAQRRLARNGHRAVYLLLALTPLSGYLSSSFTPYPMRVFGYLIPKAGWPDEGLNALFGTAHTVFAWTLLALILMHIAAVILHWLQGVPVLHRMLPGRRR